MLAFRYALLFLFVAFWNRVLAQETSDWPRDIRVSSGVITIYQPQPESFEGNKIASRSAVSYTPDNGEPVFGAVWTVATVSTNRDTRVVTVENLKVTQVRFPDDENAEDTARFKTLLETEVPKWNLKISLDQLAASLEMVEQERTQAASLNNDPPKIIYADEPTVLVLVDGEPIIQSDKELSVERVVNTPYLLVKGDDKKFYLYLAPRWFTSSSVTGDWSVVAKPPKQIRSLEKKISKADGAAKEADADGGVPRVVVSTELAELIQSSGKATFNPIQGTDLLYMSNSTDDIFMDIKGQQYYVLISGRWYKSPSVQGPWSYIASEALPADFKKIPPGSDKDNVLSSVAGTEQAKDAIADAQIPQTAKVDRRSASTQVTYDGAPRFEDITGTGMQYAVNSERTVLKDGNRYFTVDNGVWFEATAATGPWKVATERPREVEKIPPSNPTYNVKYVYIYDTTPDFVYVGYTPGYLGCYVYGPTIVYGTGWYYRPWYGAYYYPRPWTWGFGMHYNPWMGWSMGMGFATGGFSMSFSWGYGGWWGPPVYRPPYRPPYHHYYGGRPVVTGKRPTGRDRVDPGYTNNLYNKRKDVVTRDVNRRPAGPSRDVPATRDVPRDRPATREQPKTRDRQPAPSTTTRERPNNVQVDRNGNVYRRDNEQWQQRDGRSWQQTSPGRDYNQLNQTQQYRDRGTQRTQTFQQAKPMVRPAPSPGMLRRR